MDLKVDKTAKALWHNSTVNNLSLLQGLLSTKQLLCKTYAIIWSHCILYRKCEQKLILAEKIKDMNKRREDKNKK